MAKNSKQTSRKVASTASRILKDNRFGKAAKSVAGSALAQTKPKRQFPLRQPETELYIFSGYLFIKRNVKEQFYVQSLS